MGCMNFGSFGGASASVLLVLQRKSGKRAVSVRAANDSPSPAISILPFYHFTSEGLAPGTNPPIRVST